MKKSKQKSTQKSKLKVKYQTSPILVIALGVAVISGYLVYWDKIHDTKTSVTASAIVAN